MNLTLMAAVPLAVNRRCRLGSSVTSGGSTVRARRTTPPPGSPPQAPARFDALANWPSSPPPAPALAEVTSRHIGEECKLEGKLEKLALAVTTGSGRARRAASLPPAFSSAASEGEGMQQNILVVTTCISRLAGRGSASRNTRRDPRGGGSARQGGAGSSRSTRLNAS